MKEIFYYFGIMCFGYVLGTFLCFVYKWIKLGFDLVNDDYDEDLQKPIYTQEHFEFIQNLTKPDSNNDVYTTDCIKNMFNNYNQNKPDFNKQMLEADKELQRVCKNQYYIMLEGKKYKIVKPFTFD